MRLFPSTLALLAALAVARAAGAQSLTPEEGLLLQLVNAARADAGLAPVAADLALTEVARAHSREMVESGSFSHLSSRTGSPADRLRAARVPFRLSGENIAINQSVEEAHEAFMNSPGHRRNVLDPSFTHVGLGVVRGGRGLHVTEHFVRPGDGFVARAPVPAAEPPALDPYAGLEPPVAVLPPAPALDPYAGLELPVAAPPAPIASPFEAPRPAGTVLLWVALPGGGFVQVLDGRGEWLAPAF